MTDTIAKIKSLSIWQGNFEFEPLGGGLTNANYLVRDEAGQYVVRLGEDIIEHHVMRFNELAASKAAHAAGISPRVVHNQPGIMVLEYIRSKTFTGQDMRQPENLEPIIELLHKCHHDIPKYLRGPSLVFSVFQVIRDYSWTLKENDSDYLPILMEIREKAAKLESTQGVFELVFGHNDLLAANILDDGDRLWLIDWDYAGFNSPLFDLANLASNNEFDEKLETRLLGTYFDCSVSDEMVYKFRAMKCASLLRETMWSMVSELTSKIQFDFTSYTQRNLVRFDKAFDEFIEMET